MDNDSASRSGPGISSVCHVCSGMFEVDNPRSVVQERFNHNVIPLGDYHYTYVHHANVMALLMSAEAGCGLCTFLVRYLKKSRSFLFKEKRDAALRSMQANSKRPTSQSGQDDIRATQLAEIIRGREFSSNSGVHFEGWIILQSNTKECFVLLSPRSRIHVNIVDRIFPHSLGYSLDVELDYFHAPYDSSDPNLEHRPSMNLLSEAHVCLLNSWRHKCETEHTSCNKTASNQPLPSRVLELLDSSDEQKGVRLIETHRMLQGTYACLSYCWGGSKTQIGRTTRDNLETHLRCIPFQDLPNTVIDAIRLCYKLGFRFLWVDRLCIVQDDQKDWSEEASRMCDVYSRSALTISVPVCKDSTQSFLAERRKRFRDPDDFIAITHSEENSGLRGSSWFYEKPLFQDNGPWFLEKSWGSFCNNFDHTETRWLERCWTFQEWLLSPRVLHIDSMTLWDCFDGYANELNHRYMGKARLLRNPNYFGEGVSWDYLVEQYSGRKITREDDRLPALAGLAARYAQATGHTYLAGLWREDLPRSLLWEPMEPKGPANRHAPSWSWASLNGRVHFGGLDPGCFTAWASISSLFCQYNPPGSFIAVEKAWIDVEGRFCVVKEQFGGMVTVGDSKGWDKEWVARPGHGDRFSDDAINQGNVCLLLIGFEKREERDWVCYHALVLQERGWELDRPCFQRVGTAYKVPAVVYTERKSSWEERVVRLV